ncbi:sensor histidine kinase [Nitriliruptor alkaliphilus]|uniref:sensor histidine kinase n=1 Tax=Nitriliruptor alkaliphilus TaxID=427918 RepID=UPI0006967E21|nr:HAMP domain-containing sensor histidine kinase [Nitriliruptor alkaliphilus]
MEREREPTGASRLLDGVLTSAGRLVAPADVVTGRLTTLLATLWLTGGSWVMFASLLGVYDEGWLPGVLGIAGGAIVLGGTLLALRRRRLGTGWHVALTLVGSVATALVTLWAGPRGAGVTGVLFVYVTSFAAVSLLRQSLSIVVVSAGIHLAALTAAGYPAALGTWLLTWGTAIVAGAVVGVAVYWLRQLVDRLEESDELKTRFVATVSHELRTPLTAIIGFSELLLKDWDRLEDVERRRYIAVVERQAQRQLRMVEDVLTMSTILRGTVTAAPELVDVRDLVMRVVEGLRFDVAVEIDAPVTAAADPSQLEQIVENLLVNADRYGAPPVVVRAEPADGHVRIGVIDHGEGIAGGLDGDLLEAFVQGDSGDRRSSRGVGLGLTICRDLVALNDGQLTYRDTPGGGATIRVTLPHG